MQNFLFRTRLAGGCLFRFAQLSEDDKKQEPAVPGRLFVGFESKHGGTAGNDPGGKRRNEQRAGVDAAGATIEVRAEHAEHNDLRYEQNEKRHERSAEGGAEEHVCAGSDSEEERDVLDEHDEQNAADH